MLGLPTVFCSFSGVLKQILAMVWGLGFFFFFFGGFLGLYDDDQELVVFNQVISISLCSKKIVLSLLFSKVKEEL